jgi:hypothetical protein
MGPPRVFGIRWATRSLWSRPYASQIILCAPVVTGKKGKIHRELPFASRGK